MINDQKIRKLDSLVENLRKNSPFFARHFGNTGVESRFLSPEDLLSLPFMTRAILTGTSIFERLSEPSRMPYAYYESSGTTGHPVSGVPNLTAEKAESFGRFLDKWMGLSNSRIRLAAVTLAYEMNPTGMRFQLGLPHAGVTVIPCGVRSTLCPPEKTLEIMARLAPGALFSRPFELLRFADANLMRRGAPDPEVTKVFYLGEVMSHAKRARISEGWGGAEVYGHYGLTELDTGLHTCQHGNYHEPEGDSLIVELLPPQDEVLHAQQWGEGVFTNLHDMDAPVIRYRTGDLLRRIRCNCHLRTPAYEILGRMGDGIRRKSRHVFPKDIEEVIYRHPDIGNEYQFIVDDGDRLVIRLERAYGSERSIERIQADMADRLHATLDGPAEITVVPFGGLADKLGIPTTKGGRFTDIRGLSPAARENKLRINVIDSDRLRDAYGIPLGI